MRMRVRRIRAYDNDRGARSAFVWDGVVPLAAAIRGEQPQDFIGCSEPLPFGVVIVVQVPFGTSFQALAW